MSRKSEAFEREFVSNANGEEKQILAIFVRWIGFDAQVKPAVVYRGNDIEKEGYDIEKEGEYGQVLLSGNLKFYQEGNKVKNITMDSYGITT